jgi:hypothetical protein
LMASWTIVVNWLPIVFGVCTSGITICSSTGTYLGT